MPLTPALSGNYQVPDVVLRHRAQLPGIVDGEHVTVGTFLGESDGFLVTSREDSVGTVDVSKASGSADGAAPSLAADVQTLERAIYEVKRVIVGQDRLVERILVGLLAKGHVLLEGVPGVAKTLAVETFAKVVGGSFSRVQFTPDLVPTDLIGTRIYRQGREEFDTELGPVVANFVLADEINRAPAKVQSALLEVMAERHVSIGGKRYHMPDPFLVMATQNPIENEGVYPLPEAQRDLLPVQDPRRLPDCRGRTRNRLPDGCGSPGAAPDPRSGGVGQAPTRRQQRLRPPRARRLRGQGHRRYAYAA